MTAISKSAVCLGVMLLACSVSHAAEFPFVGEATSDKVNVRAGGNTNFEKLATLPKGSAVVVVDRQFDWYKIELPEDAKVYVRSDYIKSEEGALGTVTGNKVNVRASMSTEASVVGQLEKGAAVKIVEKVNEWSRIRPMEGIYGWVSKDFLAMKSRTIPDELKNRYARPALKPAAMAATNPEAAVEAPKLVVARVHVKGVLERLDSPTSADIQYRIRTEDRTIYDLKAADAPWKNFVHAVVGLDGTVIKNAPTPQEATIVQPSRIELIL